MSTKKLQIIVPTEHEEQKTLCQWLDGRKIKYFSVPNSGRRNYKTANYFKSEGLRAGAPDLVLITMAWHAIQCVSVPVAIEMKRTHGGKLKPEQLAMHAELAESGWIVVVAKGADDAIAQLIALGY